MKIASGQIKRLLHALIVGMLAGCAHTYQRFSPDIADLAGIKPDDISPREQKTIADCENEYGDRLAELQLKQEGLSRTLKNLRVEMAALQPSLFPTVNKWEALLARRGELLAEGETLVSKINEMGLEWIQFLGTAETYIRIVDPAWYTPIDADRARASESIQHLGDINWIELGDGVLTELDESLKSAENLEVEIINSDALNQASACLSNSPLTGATAEGFKDWVTSLGKRATIRNRSGQIKIFSELPLSPRSESADTAPDCSLALELQRQEAKLLRIAINIGSLRRDVAALRLATRKWHSDYEGFITTEGERGDGSWMHVSDVFSRKTREEQKREQELSVKITKISEAETELASCEELISTTSADYQDCIRNARAEDEKTSVLKSYLNEEGYVQKWHALERKYGCYEMYSLLSPRAVEVPENAPVPNRIAEMNQKKLDALYEDEFAIFNSGILSPDRRYVGLALSGGGIRSASFACGILQGLHQIGVLTNVGYVSSVSGGGEAALWYMSHPSDREIFEPGSMHLQHLAQYGQYLKSGHFSKAIASPGLFINWTFQTLFKQWPFNGVFDFELNVGPAPTVYREGIQRAFYYRVPLQRRPGERVQADESMHFMSPRYRPGKPFWIINMHLALREDDTHHRNRTGDMFELTPLRAGANAVGYVNVPPQLSASEHWMTPLYGTAISAAAIDPVSMKGGYGTSLSDAFNFDLGRYIDGWSDGWLAGDSPGIDHVDPVALNTVAFWATSLFPLYKMCGWSKSGNVFERASLMHEHTVFAKRYYLTDGGHFNNLGAYSLIRRGCRLIIISDAEMDPYVNRWEGATNGVPEWSSGAPNLATTRSRSFEALRNLELLVNSDFGAHIDMDWASFSPSNPVMTGWIRNFPVQNSVSNTIADVRIIYFKASYNNLNKLRSRDTFIDAEKGRVSDFPNESTANQFYDEQKVVSYRELARSLVWDNRPTIKKEVTNTLAYVSSGTRTNSPLTADD